MTEKRKYARWQVLRHLRLFERGTNVFLGHVVDVSETGFLLRGEQRFPTDKTLQVWMEVPFEGEQPARLQFDATIVRREHVEDQALFEYGLHATGMLPRARLIIQDFIADLKPGS
jgi:hypothetical protein